MTTSDGPADFVPSRMHGAPGPSPIAAAFTQRDAEAPRLHAVRRSAPDLLSKLGRGAYVEPSQQTVGVFLVDRRTLSSSRLRFAASTSGWHHDDRVTAAADQCCGVAVRVGVDRCSGDWWSRRRRRRGPRRARRAIRQGRRRGARGELPLRRVDRVRRATRRACRSPAPLTSAVVATTSTTKAGAAGVNVRVQRPTTSTVPGYGSGPSTQMTSRPMFAIDVAPPRGPTTRVGWSVGSTRRGRCADRGATRSHADRSSRRRGGSLGLTEPVHDRLADASARTMVQTGGIPRSVAAIDPGTPVLARRTGAQPSTAPSGRRGQRAPGRLAARTFVRRDRVHRQDDASIDVECGHVTFAEDGSACRRRRGRSSRPRPWSVRRRGI